MIGVVLRITATVIWTVALFGILGGGFAWRDDLPDGHYNRFTLTMYKTLPAPPRGPSYCDLVEVGRYALVRPCDWQPPFIGWLQGRWR